MYVRNARFLSAAVGPTTSLRSASVALEASLCLDASCSPRRK
jgi:hypothetical protein